MGRIVRWILALTLALAGVLVAVTLLDAVVPPVSTLMLGRWATLKPVDRRWVPIEAISPRLVHAVILSEDARFCSHDGVDWDALRTVLGDADEDGPSRGASTITMQTAKNLFLWPSRSYVRKGLELPLALWLDLVWSKRRVMEVYLNIAEWGPGVFGAEAASQVYFGKSAADLSVREATLLTKSLPNPLKRNPAKPSRGLQRLAAKLSGQLGDAEPWVQCVRVGRSR
ncbi:monofunctional biosynthetic peptidoglycan transglycosylase [Alsobacter sp. KACC 23698]|uniref:Biosynthetic peptidoglycan transglycosylase n=1 Tax=Alsobacter sp. KACC 23698 TaxID=3149229 RepID=A0AAU7JCT9_9HYPH